MRKNPPLRKMFAEFAQYVIEYKRLAKKMMRRRQKY
jgi:hypothetical protein